MFFDSPIIDFIQIFARISWTTGWLLSDHWNFTSSKNLTCVLMRNQIIMQCKVLEWCTSVAPKRWFSTSRVGMYLNWKRSCLHCTHSHTHTWVQDTNQCPIVFHKIVLRKLLWPRKTRTDNYWGKKWQTHKQTKISWVNTVTTEQRQRSMLQNTFERLIMVELVWWYYRWIIVIIGGS